MTTARKRSARSMQSEARFRARIDELGGEVLDEVWGGSSKGHRIRCSEGHESTSRPSDVLQGKGICRTCAGCDPKAAEAAFRARLAEFGAVMVEPKWRGVIKRHKVICSAGHTCYPVPHMLRQRHRRVCLECPRPDSTAAWDKFRMRVEELGGETLDTEWRGNRQKYAVRCSEGHTNLIWPIGLHQGRGICRACAGFDPEGQWAKFKSSVERLGGTVREAAWKGKDEPHACLCPEGHECQPRPGHLSQGIGMCGACAGKSWDVFYVVSDEINDVVKFGVTSGDPRPRLGTHARDGFDSVVRLIEGLPDDLAPRLERAVLSALRDAREVPVRGREYFPARVLGLVLDLADGWTSPPEQLTPEVAA